MRHLIFSTAFAAIAAGTASAADFGTYRALYDLEPAKVAQASAAMPIDGKIAYEVTGSECAGYTIDTDYTTRYTDAEAGVRAVDTKSTTFESPDGLKLQISQTQTINKEVSDDAKITAAKSSPDAAGDVDQQGTKKQHFSIPAGMIFPTAHQKRLLTAAMAGQTRDVSMVYDGSDGEKQFKVVTFIGKKREPGSYTPDLANPEAQALQGMASWPFQLGYYAVDNANSDEPDFQATFNMYENGVSTEMLFDYGNFSMKGKLTKFEAITPDACDGGTKDGKAATQPQ